MGNHKKGRSIMKKIIATNIAAAMVLTSFPSSGNVNTAKAGQAPSGLMDFPLNQVQVTDDYYLTAQESDIYFLAAFDTDRMLSRFRETAGLSTQGKSPYRGWEDSFLGGHCVGHWLTAAAQAVKTTGDEGLLDMLNYMIDELKVCQDALGTGFIFGAKIQDKNNVEKQFNIVEGKDSGDTWVPWYNMHKLVAGLVDVYRYTDNEKALEVAKNLGTWIYNRVSKWDKNTQNRILWTEYGGMNDCLYELYRITDDTRYRDAAHMFDDPDLYKTITSGNADTLNGRHANATIPKFVGALNRYRVLSEKGELTSEDEQYLYYVEDFWTLMIEKHAYATGGVSDMEHFRQDNALDATRTQCNCESCCVHNILKITRELFKITGDVKYSDYYETTLRNAIMGAVDAETGAFSYFTPMATGYFKFFGETDPANNMFWCCTGSGMENYTKLNDSIYFHNDDSVVINQYIASTLSWEEQGFYLTQDSDVTKSDVANFAVDVDSPVYLNIYLRVPEWVSGQVYLTVNGEAVNNVDVTDGYIELNRMWNSGDTFSIKYPMTVQPIGLPDNNTVFAFRYGPTLLAAELGTERMDLKNGDNLTWAGANLSAAKWKVVGGEEAQLTIGYNTTNRQILGTETLYIEDASLEQFMLNIADNLVRDTESDTLAFKLTGTDADDNFTDGLTFVPFNTLNDARYGIYWYFSALSQEELEATILKDKEDRRNSNNLIDSIQPGYGQYEQDKIHDIKEENSVAGTIEQGGSTRYASAGGYFQYNFQIEPGKGNSVLCRFAKEDNGKTIKLSVGDSVIATETLDYAGEELFYTKAFPIPADVLAAATKDLTVTNDAGTEETFKVVTVRFESADSNDSARLVGGIYTLKDFDNNASITSITPTTEGILTQSGDTYTLYVPAGSQTVKANVNLANKAGLLYVNDILVNDGKVQTFTVNGNDATFALKVYAEDHATCKTYTLNIVQGLEKAPKPDTPVPSTPGGNTPGVTPPAPGTPSAPKKSIKITGKKVVKVGKSIKLKAKLKGVKGKVKWSVNKKKLAKINQKGKLTAKKKGKVKVTAKVKKIKATVTIKIKK